MARLGVGELRLRQRGVCEGQRAVMVISKTTNGRWCTVAQSHGRMIDYLSIVIKKVKLLLNRV